MGSSQPVGIRRIGLALEMEDGSTVMVYAEPRAARVTFTTERPEYESWFYNTRRLSGPPKTSILVEGLESYTIVHGEPDGGVRTAPGRMLEASKLEVMRDGEH